MKYIQFPVHLSLYDLPRAIQVKGKAAFLTLASDSPTLLTLPLTTKLYFLDSYSPPLQYLHDPRHKKEKKSNCGYIYSG